jgi:hypothetical protein
MIPEKFFEDQIYLYQEYSLAECLEVVKGYMMQPREGVEMIYKDGNDIFLALFYKSSDKKIYYTTKKMDELKLQ